MSALGREACAYSVLGLASSSGMDSKIASIRRPAQPPNKSLQRAVTDKVLGRGRPSAERTRALRARVLKGRRAAAELNR
jgi:hypothetical protein